VAKHLQLRLLALKGVLRLRVRFALVVDRQPQRSYRCLCLVVHQHQSLFTVGKKDNPLLPLPQQVLVHLVSAEMPHNRLLGSEFAQLDGFRVKATLQHSHQST
jgi:hypothetical protein